MLQAVIAYGENQYRMPKVIMHDTELPGFEARLAISLVERWGMVSAVDAGEDSSGRSKGRLLTPREVVNRACETAEVMVAEIRSRNWFAILPSYPEMIAEAKKKGIEEAAQVEADRIKRAADRAEREVLSYEEK